MPVERDIIWTTWDGNGFEHLRLRPDGSDSVIADSLLVVVHEGEATRARYQIHSDQRWRVREVRVEVSRPNGEAGDLHLLSDGQGNWQRPEGSPVPVLDGCIDIDLSLTPYTNTLPIRRLNLQPGAIEPIRATFIEVLALDVEPWDQQYTGHDESHVRYESVGRNFVRDLEIDADGLVITYPGLLRRTWAT